MHKSRLALGTAQFGLPYGIANSSGQISLSEASAILQYAWLAGIDTLDTAIAYGESEQRLGEVGVDKWQIVSKLPSVPEGCKDVGCWVEESVMNSLARLKIPHLHGLLLHRPDQLMDSFGGELFNELCHLKEEGLIHTIGISIYNPEELDRILSTYAMDLVQVPFSILDRRLETSGWLTRLHAMGIEVHVRSVFLQGLLLMKADQRPEKFSRWQYLWDQWDAWLKTESLTPLQACLGFVLSFSEIDRIVVGIDNRTQLEEIIAATDIKSVKLQDLFRTDDLDLIIPSRWNQL
jgi:hypothetical protein